MTTLLLAEDEPSIQLVARLSLKRAGFAVTVASNGVEALAKAQEILPDVVLLDWMMPEMDGIEVCRALKADARTHAIPVIFLTARSQENDLLKG
jgi:CheY-like chemotaxis protein